MNLKNANYMTYTFLSLVNLTIMRLLNPMPINILKKKINHFTTTTAIEEKYGKRKTIIEAFGSKT
jgi:hypothetical protein